MSSSSSETRNKLTFKPTQDRQAVMRILLDSGFNLIGVGRCRLVFGSPNSDLVYKIQYTRENGFGNEAEWNKYQKLLQEEDEWNLVVPIHSFTKIIGGSVLVQERVQIISPYNMTKSQRNTAEEIVRLLKLKDPNLYAKGNFGYYKGTLRIIDIDR